MHHPLNIVWWLPECECECVTEINCFAQNVRTKTPLSYASSSSTTSRHLPPTWHTHGPSYSSLGTRAMTWNACHSNYSSVRIWLRHFFFSFVFVSLLFAVSSVFVCRRRLFSNNFTECESTESAAHKIQKIVEIWIIKLVIMWHTPPHTAHIDMKFIHISRLTFTLHIHRVICLSHHHYLQT